MKKEAIKNSNTVFFLEKQNENYKKKNSDMMEECKSHKENLKVGAPIETPVIRAHTLKTHIYAPKPPAEEKSGSLAVEEAQLARLASWAKGEHVEEPQPTPGPYAALEKEALDVAREVDECIENARCDRNCNHAACKSTDSFQTVKSHMQRL